MLSTRNNKHDDKTAWQAQTAEYVIIGGGPAAICAVAKLYGSGVPGDKIVWVDPKFKVGDFGTKLSVGSSVPGNTAVESYQEVNNAIYSMIPECEPGPEEKVQFEMSSLSPDTPCSLRVATQPLQHITNNLRKLVRSVEGVVPVVQEIKGRIRVSIKSADSTTRYVIAKRVILAVGAELKTMRLASRITTIDPNITFIESQLKRYLDENSGIKVVAVIGSSHSAALAAMHLLQAGIKVKQFMNKEYKFATPAISSDGIRYTRFDNTGLKGIVAIFTRKLLSDARTGQGKYNGMWECYTDKNITTLSDCTHAVVCIGYKPTCYLQVNGLPLSEFMYDKHTTQMIGVDERLVSGVFGIGVAFPPEVKSISGELEFAVGVGKFWASLDNRILKEWKDNPAGKFLFSSTPLAPTHFLHTAVPKKGIVKNISENDLQNRNVESLQIQTKL